LLLLLRRQLLAASSGWALFCSGRLHPSKPPAGLHGFTYADRRH
jgi:hypothetical protein